MRARTLFLAGLVTVALGHTAIAQEAIGVPHQQDLEITKYDHMVFTGMNGHLTADGIKLCTGILATRHPSISACETALGQAIPTADFMFSSPAMLFYGYASLPPWDGKCVAVEKNKINNRVSYVYFCTRPAHIIWLPGTAFWRWSFDHD